MALFSCIAMSSSGLILVLGYDERLLETRRMVLERAGFQVLTAHQMEQAKEVTVTSDVDLLLLCHTLSDRDVRNVASYVREERLSTKLLLITTVTASVFEGPWQTVDALAGAEKMIIAARQALEA
jgi:CheY-like chemotaxis protein